MLGNAGGDRLVGEGQKWRQEHHRGRLDENKEEGDNRVLLFCR
jgi:hypothetical protein